MKYFEICDDLKRHGDAWYLDFPTDPAGKEIVSPTLEGGVPYVGPVPTIVPVYAPGSKVQFSLGAGAPIVTEDIAAALRSAVSSGYELFPVTVEGESGRYYILNATELVPCLDENLSLFSRHKKPEKGGKIEIMYRLVIDPSKACGRDIFRIPGWTLPLIVSEKVKDALVNLPDLGVVFKPVSHVWLGGSKKELPSPEPDIPALGLSYSEFYSQLFSPLESLLGTLDNDAIVPLLGLDAEGLLIFRTFGKARGDAIVSYASCELAVRQEQKTDEFGHYELLVTCDNEEWARKTLTRIARMSFNTVFGHAHTLDITAWVKPEDSIRGIVFEAATSTSIKGHPFGILRCIGVTAAELQYAQMRGAASLIQILKKEGVYPNTLIGRRSVL